MTEGFETPLLDELIEHLRGLIEAEFKIPDWVPPEQHSKWRNDALRRTAMMRLELDRVLMKKAELYAYLPKTFVIER